MKHAVPIRLRTAGATSSRTLRGVLVAGVVLALGAGLWVRSVFRGAALEQSVAAAPRPAEGPPAAPPAAAPDWTPPNLRYPMTPPLRPALTELPSTADALTGPTLTPMMGGAIPAVDAQAPNTGMVSITPSARPSGRTTFTDGDLAATRTQAPVTAAPVSPSVGSAAASRPDDDAAQEWTDRIRDRADDVQEAQAKARRLAAEATTLRARAAGVIIDEGEREKVDRELMDVLGELERAERNVRDAERRLDETKADARREGVTVR